MTRHPRAPSPTLVDTGEREAIVDEVVEKMKKDVTMEDVRKAISDHVAACPALELGEKLDGFRQEFVEFRGEIRGQIKLVMWGIPLLLTLGGLLVTAVWKISELQRHAPHATISRDAGIPAGTAVACSSNK